MTAETRRIESTAAAVEILFMSFELGSTTWKLAFATIRGMRPRLRIDANPARPRRRSRVWRGIGHARTRNQFACDSDIVTAAEMGKKGRRW